MNVNRREFIKALFVGLVGLVVFRTLKLPKGTGVKGWWEGNTFVLETGNKRLYLNETGGRVAEMVLGGERDPKVIAQRLSEAYDVELSAAERDVRELLNQLGRLA